MAVLLGILQAIVALPKIGDLFLRAITSISEYYKRKHTSEKRRQIEQAAMLTKSAKTKEARREAARRWQSAIRY